jgi:tyrosine-protein phosphatase YwqE
MFHFFKKKNTVENIASCTSLPIKTDIHSHLLPGIDDGSPNIETSLHLIHGLYELGIRESITTPHIIGDLYPNNPDTISKAYIRLQEALTKDGIDFKLNYAAEYLMDDFFVQLLKDESKLLTIKEEYLLVEQSWAFPTANLSQIALELRTKQYKPIMAHPERYSYCSDNYDSYYRLKDMGFLLQLNLLSVTGYYGVSAERAAKFLIEEDLIDFVGTDLHHIKHLRLLCRPSNLALLDELLAVKRFNTFL